MSFIPRAADGGMVHRGGQHSQWKSTVRKVAVRFSVNLPADDGALMVLCGSTSSLGDWDPARGLPFRLNPGGTEWQTEAEDTPSTVEYKLVQIRSGQQASFQWE
eukprot:CAMPEP_0114320692 /NCGR_PEP_ID=MMETSP0059-20121206/26103_1 /TAXON_ID=36894 /ORGANISM="Pyramimonas parkeae, Strain CCMP726" /LENGTH=103 /DNA_ID=CAMNT_0001448169 /DNA_START=184 /DNA_END=492 /DNA_ORIENTATION=+